MNHLNKKSVGFGLLTLIFVVTLLGFRPKNVSAFWPKEHQQDVLAINASDTDSTQSEDEDPDDDDEWEA